ncbi:glycosyltransferase family 2 protein [Methanospirillum sp.]
MTDPKVTVLMSVYNGDRYLNEAIDSILAQTYTDFEFLIINDASTDSTPEILVSYDDQRIRIVTNEENLGLTKSLNRGLALARGKYIARMDADDISFSHRLEIQTEFMDQHPEIGVCGSAIQFFGDKDSILSYPETPEEISISLLFFCPLAHPSVMIRKNVLELYNLTYDETIRYAQDFELWVRCSKFTSLYNLKIPLLGLRSHHSQISMKHLEQQTKYRNTIIQKNLSRLISEPSYKELSTHFHIINNNETWNIWNMNKTTLSDIRIWLIKLQKANKRKKIFENCTFNKFIAKIWFSQTFYKKGVIQKTISLNLFYHIYCLFQMNIKEILSYCKPYIKKKFHQPVQTL